MRTRHAFRPTLDGTLEARLCLSRPAAPVAATPARLDPGELEATRAAERLEAMRDVTDRLEAAREAAEGRVRERTSDLKARIEELELDDRSGSSERAKLDALRGLAGEERLRTPLDALDALRAVAPTPAEDPAPRAAR